MLNNESLSQIRNLVLCNELTSMFLPSAECKMCVQDNVLCMEVSTPFTMLLFSAGIKYFISIRVKTGKKFNV